MECYKIRKADFRSGVRVAKAVAAQSGQPWLYHYFDYIYSIVRYGVGERQYVTSGFWKLRRADRKKTYTAQRRNRLQNLFNPKEFRHILGNKDEFNTLFSDFMKRAWLDCQQADAATVTAFLAGHRDVIVKPVGRTKGRGIHALDFAGRTTFEVAAELAGTRVLLEEMLVQHPRMCFNNRSVNTVRINTVLDREGQVHVLKCCLRCGVGDALVDNFSAGGVFYPIHKTLGRIEGPGESIALGQAVYVHPESDIFMPGREIPYWDEAVAIVTEAAKRVPQLRFIGWDLAILEKGPELIEGNTLPGENLLEALGTEKGFYKQLLSYL